MLGQAPDETPEIEWQTGTALDEFTPIYRALAVATKTHGAMSPPEVDACDIPTVALLLGIGTDPGWDDLRQLAELGRRRQAGEDVSWDTA
jgi:hypothetical protein